MPTKAKNTRTKKAITVALAAVFIFSVTLSSFVITKNIDVLPTGSTTTKYKTNGSHTVLIDLVNFFHLLQYGKGGCTSKASTFHDYSTTSHPTLQTTWKLDCAAEIQICCVYLSTTALTLRSVPELKTSQWPKGAYSNSWRKNMSSIQRRISAHIDKVLCQDSFTIPLEQQR